MSEQLYRRALVHVPAGVHSNTRIRTPAPLFVDRADGQWVHDADGTRWLDFTMGNGSVILGHNHPAVQEAVRDSLERGTTAGYETVAAVEAVELLAEVLPALRAVRFANTGTEAVMHALALARAATGRRRVAKVEASYHGWADAVWVSTWPPLDQAGPVQTPVGVPGSAGLSAEADTTLVLPFNDVAATTDLLERHGTELAAVILEPVMIDIGFVPATEEFIQSVRDLCDKFGVLLIFDELLTGFRIAMGGAREVYATTPDLTLYGKAIANGYPLAAVEGSRDLLDLSDPATGGEVGWVGTYNGHATSMAAARASLRELRSGAVVQRLRELTDRLKSGVAELAESTGAAVVMAGGGGHFQPYFSASAPSDYRSAAASNVSDYAALVEACRSESVLIAEGALGHCALSTAHTEDDIDLLLGCIQASLSVDAR
jgi:glutamate-1-semialdehyde 2,1-aminomutase